MLTRRYETAVSRDQAHPKLKDELAVGSLVWALSRRLPKLRLSVSTQRFGAQLAAAEGEL